MVLLKIKKEEKCNIVCVYLRIYWVNIICKMNIEILKVFEIEDDGGSFIFLLLLFC